MPRTKNDAKLPEFGIIPIHLTPRAPRNSIEGWITDAAGKAWLKVRITAPPEDGKANAALIRFIAKERGVAPSRITLVSGHSSRYKMLKID